jgi:ribosomal 50S subunit-recycling heat shock protein
MRLDKFLKVSRLIKRRTVAKEIADQGRIDINGKVAKSSSDVKTVDVLTIRFGNKTSEIQIDRIMDITKKDEAERMYTIQSESFTTE